MDALRWLFRKSDALSRFGNFTILVFVIAQCLDGISTYIGVNTYGIGVERNPLIVWVISVMGVGFGLVTVKLVAIGAGLLIYWRGHYNFIALLSVFYLVLALFPWVHLFLTHRFLQN